MRILLLVVLGLLGDRGPIAAEPVGAGSSKFQEFQKFSSGDLPIEEAVVSREISRKDGTVVNRDWLRFGFQEQGRTWFAQRLAPLAADPAKLGPVEANEISGASFDRIWVITDRNVHVAEKGASAGSVPEKFQELPHTFMLGAISLGLPAIHPRDIRWHGAEWRSRIGTKRDAAGDPAATNEVRGAAALDGEGVPVRCEYKSGPDYSGAIISYWFGSGGIPVKIVRRMVADGTVYKWEFSKLKLGAVDLRESGGYVPTMFAASDIPRVGTIWANELPYTVLSHATVPAFQSSNPQTIPTGAGARVIGLSAVAVLCLLGVLALSYWRWKTSDRPNPVR